jgi:2-oxoisovalerate dehydrogenase E1 component
MGIHWALEMQEHFPDRSIEILDLRSLSPWDKEAVEKTVKKTNRVLVLHEDCLTGGIGGEIAAWIGENLFTYLDAPVMRCASLDTPVPFSSKLEENFLPKGRIPQKIKELLEF